jgi:hypothetical protein
LELAGEAKERPKVELMGGKYNGGRIMMIYA